MKTVRDFERRKCLGLIYNLYNEIHFKTNFNEWIARLVTKKNKEDYLKCECMYINGIISVIAIFASLLLNENCIFPPIEAISPMQKPEPNVVETQLFYSKTIDLLKTRFKI